jgi:GDP-L-fucose synthase
LPALLVKAILAKKNKRKEIILWGTGKAKRELTYVDDVADACIYFLNKKTKESLINIGSGHEMSILNYAKFILKKINYNCKIVLDNSKPDGMPRKIVDSSIARSYGWLHKVELKHGLELTLKNNLSLFKNI